MPGDYSRFTDDALKHFSRVLMQQGKVQLDADWNEEVEIGIRRERLQALDVFGRAAVPRTTPGAFEITALPNDLGIGAGRIYVDGVLVEAFEGEKPLTYNDQPFLRHHPPPSIEQLPQGKGLVYLHVREREITSAEDPSLLEPALGDIDTTTRTQTYWQVNILPLGQARFSALKCGSDLTTIFKPTDARLTVHVDLPEEEPDPCQVKEIGGFIDVENRHYFVEVHDKAHLKFRRDPVVAEIEEIIDSAAGTTTFRVKRIGRDPVLRFRKDDCVEFMNERIFLDGEPGVMAHVTNVDEARLEITIDAGTSAGIGNLAVAGPLQPRLIRWDQRLDQGALLIPIDTTKKIPLEAGISIEIKGTEFRTGDYWAFAARAATRTAGPLVDAPPRGVTDHYATLAMITGLGTKTPAVESDCRTLWPPECDCECAACVNPSDHNKGRATIQMAIDDVNAHGGGTVCLKPGVYYLNDKPLDLNQVFNVRIRGHGAALVVYLGEQRHMVLINQCVEVAIENVFFIRGSEVKDGFDAIGILIRNCIQETVIEDCRIWLFSLFSHSPTPRGIAIALDGIVDNVKIVDCHLNAGAGVRSYYEIGVPTSQRSLTEATALDIRNNDITGTVGIWIEAIGLSATIRDNVIDAILSGVHLQATTAGGAQNLIDGNQIATRETGIQFYGDRTTASNNVIAGKLVHNPKNPVIQTVLPRGNGIVVRAESANLTTSACHVLANRCTNLNGTGILVLEQAEGLMIKNNVISETAGAGIAVDDGAAKSNVTIENNHLRDVALGKDASVKGWFGIRLGPQCNGSVATNTVAGVGSELMTLQLPDLSGAGIRAEAPGALRIHENNVSAVAPAMEIPAAGIDIAAPFDTVEITNNIVKVESFFRVPATDPAGGRPAALSGMVFALRVQAPPTASVNWIAVPVNTEFVSRIFIDTNRASCWSSPPRLSQLLVRANHFEVTGTTNGSASVVHIEEPAARCIFGGNFCSTSFSSNSVIDTTVFIHALKLVCDSNQIQGAAQRSADLRTGNLKNEDWTILGNITDSKLTINNASLPAPTWASLNRIA